jgi:hypothetical protein
VTIDVVRGRKRRRPVYSPGKSDRKLGKGGREEGGGGKQEEGKGSEVEIAERRMERER